jgi:hypothetical protein
MTLPVTQTPAVDANEVFTPRLAKALSALMLGSGQSGTLSTITGTLKGASATTTASIPVPAGTSAELRVKITAKVTTKGGGAEAVGDENYVNEVVVVKNVSGTAAVVPNQTEVSVTAQDTTMPIPATHGNVGVSTSNAVVTFTATVLQMNS